MIDDPITPAIEADSIAPLAIALDKVCWVIYKARAFHAKDVATVSDPGSNASDDDMIGVLEDRPGDPVEEELRSFLAALSEDEQVDLVTLAWLGRDDDNTLADWSALRGEAARAHRPDARQTATYLLGDPLISDYLDEALSKFQMSCADVTDERF
jgi:Protein of unknown function (DUF3775)